MRGDKGKCLCQEGKGSRSKAEREIGGGEGGRGADRGGVKKREGSVGTEGGVDTWEDRKGGGGKREAQGERDCKARERGRKWKGVEKQRE